MGNELSQQAGDTLTKNVDKRFARSHHRESWKAAIEDWKTGQSNLACYPANRPKARGPKIEVSRSGLGEARNSSEGPTDSVLNARPVDSFVKDDSDGFYTSLKTLKRTQSSDVNPVKAYEDSKLKEATTTMEKIFYAANGNLESPPVRLRGRKSSDLDETKAAAPTTPKAIFKTGNARESTASSTQLADHGSDEGGFTSKEKDVLNWFNDLCTDSPQRAEALFSRMQKSHGCLSLSDRKKDKIEISDESFPLPVEEEVTQDEEKEDNQKHSEDAKSSRWISVYVRKRPMFTKENESDFDVVDTSGELTGSNTVVVFDTRMKPDMKGMQMTPNLFRFDKVFGENDTNSSVFFATAQSLVQHALEGNFALGFVFGATGSGKTHTMSGIIKLSAAHIFKHVDKVNSESDTQPTIEVSSFELYGTKCRDLLTQPKVDQKSRSPSRSPRVNLKSSPTVRGKAGDTESYFRILEDKSGALRFPGLTTKKCHLEEDLLEAFDNAQSLRITTGTGVHDRSSRSHAFYRIRIIDGERQGELFFVDLAGSEWNKDSVKHDPILQKESAEINTSLMALKNCIRSQALGKSFVPYRGSMLTRILKKGLSEKSSKTVVIGTIAPSSADTEHTLSTLSAISTILAGVGGLQVSDCQSKLGTMEVQSLAAIKSRNQEHAANPKRWSEDELQKWWKSVAPKAIEPPQKVTGVMMIRWPQFRFVQHCVESLSSEKERKESLQLAETDLKSTNLHASDSPNAGHFRNLEARMNARSGATRPKNSSVPRPAIDSATTRKAQQIGDKLYHKFRNEVINAGKRQHMKAQANRR